MEYIVNYGDVIQFDIPTGKKLHLPEGVAWDGPIDDQLQIGDTADVLYGGDMSGDSAGLGIQLSSADGTRHFAHAVYADDGGQELGAGWVSGIFGSMVIYTAVTPSANLSAFGVTGQLHVDANVASIGNLCGLYGVAETSGAGVTVDANLFGGVFGVTLASGDTLGDGYYAGGILIGGNYAGTSTGKLVAVFVQNPSGDNFDAFAALGQNSEEAGCVVDAAVGGSNTKKIKWYIGGTLMYTPLYTA